MKAVEVGLTVAIVVDNSVSKVKHWNKNRKAESARKKRLIEEIKKS